MKFWKVQSIGNDFVLVRRSEVEGLELGGLARAVSDRRFGIGADGLLVVSPGSNLVELRMFNPDGTEDFCGNGLRCAGLFAFREGWVGSDHAIHHLGRKVAASVHADGAVTVRTEAASFRPDDVPTTAPGELVDALVAGIPVTVLTTGSAHAVTFVDELPDDAAFFSVSPRVEHDPMFPERVSLMWVRPEGDGALRLRIWERGAGETMGCGTGSVAAAVAWSRRTGATGTVTVLNPGGALTAELDDWRGPVRATTRPEVVYTGALDPTTLGLTARGTAASPQGSPR